MQQTHVLVEVSLAYQGYNDVDYREMVGCTYPAQVFGCKLDESGRVRTSFARY